MPIVDFAKLEKYLEIPASARRMLEKSEKEITFDVSLRLDEGKLLESNGYLIYRNTARGLAKGGVRFWPDVTLEETRDLAELMVYKTALTKIPFGGGKAGIAMDPQALTPFEKMAIMKEFVHMIWGELVTGAYCAAPDLGTNPGDMAVIYGETHIPESVTGKPTRIGGLPGRREATGRGVAFIVRSAVEQILQSELGGKTVAIQGFGNVGSWSALFLREMGARIVAVSDMRGGVYDDQGLPIPELFKFVSEGHWIPDFDRPQISNAELLALPVDILIPAAVEDVLTGENADQVRAKLIVEAANDPTTPEADVIFDARGLPVIPDILANAGGVVASYVEWRKGKSGSITEKSETYQTVESQLAKSFEDVFQAAEEHKISYRLAAHLIAVDEVIKTMQDRQWI